MLLESDAPVTIGSEIRDDERVLDTIISAARAGAVQRPLVVLPLKRQGTLTLGDLALIDGVAVCKRAHKGRLAR